MSDTEIGIESDDERHKRQWFAQRTVDWLEHKLKGRELHRLVVFAPPQLLGDIRRQHFNFGPKIVHTCRGNLAHLQAGQLARHPAVREALLDSRIPETVAARRGANPATRRNHAGRRRRAPAVRPALPGRVARKPGRSRATEDSQP